jgi:hypothetical protein
MTIIQLNEFRPAKVGKGSIQALNQLPQALKDSPAIKKWAALCITPINGLATISMPDCCINYVSVGEAPQIKVPGVRRLIEQARTYVEFDGIKGVQLIGLSDQPGAVDPDRKFTLPGIEAIYIRRISLEPVELTGVAMTPHPPANIDQLIDRIIKFNLGPWKRELDEQRKALDEQRHALEKREQDYWSLATL